MNETIKDQPKKLLKYFVVKLDKIKEWNLKDYLFFVIEALWQTCIPFVAGVLFSQTQQLYWIVFLILPIYFKFKVDRGFYAKKEKKIYFR